MSERYQHSRDVLANGDRQLERNAKIIHKNERLLRWFGWMIGPILRPDHEELLHQDVRLRAAQDELRAAIECRTEVSR